MSAGLPTPTRDGHPACGHHSLPRDPADLAPGTDGLRSVLTAVHHATDTLTHIAVADARCVRRAAADHRLYIATRLLPENYDIPYPYGPAPRSRVTALLDGYRLAVKTCTDATAALDALALTARAPSHVLAAAHTAPAASQPSHAAPSAQADRQQEKRTQEHPPLIPRGKSGRMEEAVRNLRLTDPALLIRAAAIDEAARDLLAEATAKARHQTTSHVPNRAAPPRPSRRRT